MAHTRYRFKQTEPLSSTGFLCLSFVPAAGLGPASPLSFPRKAFGGLVPLGFDVAVFTPAAYLRRRLRRPCAEILSRGGLRA